MCGVWLQVAEKVKEKVAAAQEHIGAPDSHSATTAAGMRQTPITIVWRHPSPHLPILGYARLRACTGCLPEVCASSLQEVGSI